MILVLSIAALLCSLLPALLFFRNLFLYNEPPIAGGAIGVSVLIPARNEESGIADAIIAILASRGVDLEVVVMDDCSTDGTGEVVAALASQHQRVRLEQAPALPRGWNGKQHACWALAQTARFPVLCFIDADVRLEPDCIARMACFLRGKSLVSGFPRQVTGTTLEWLLLPLIHFVLLGFLPLGRMRASNAPALAAGCGQFMMVRADDYFACGGHSGIKLTMHDGLRLPRLFREHGFRTDIADITLLARCRMYTSAAQVWSGLAKNATEGLAAPTRILPITFLLILGQVMPFLCVTALLAAAIYRLSALSHHMYALGVSPSGTFLLGSLVVCVIIDWTVRVLAAVRFHQDWRSALLHPVGIFLLLVVQWYALTRNLLGRPVSWRSRAYTKQ